MKDPAVAGRFFVVVDPGPDSELADFVTETTARDFALAAIGGGAAAYETAAAFSTRFEALVAATARAEALADHYFDLASETAREAALEACRAGLPRPEGAVGEAYDLLVEAKGPAA